MGPSPNRHPCVNGCFEPLPLSETVREFDRAKGGDVARDAKRWLHLVTSTPLLIMLDAEGSVLGGEMSDVQGHDVERGEPVSFGGR